MKKYLLLFLLLSSVTVVSADEKDVRMETGSTTPVTRSIIQKPTVTIDDVTFHLSVSMLSDEAFTLFVYDESDAIVHQESLMTDGTKHLYLLPQLEEGSYSIEIKGEKRTFEGDFSI